jgi:hypothetical protein
VRPGKSKKQAASPKEPDLRKFELDRSSNAATAANENSRPMAQTAVLINGAAATAIIAFLTREKIDPVMLRWIPVSLGFYASGVAIGALSYYFMTEALDYWNCFWELTARAESQEDIDEQERLGNQYWGYVRACFFTSIAGFVLGSAIFACAVSHLR